MLAEGDPEKYKLDGLKVVFPGRGGKWMSSVKYSDFLNGHFKISKLCQSLNTLCLL